MNKTTTNIDKELHVYLLQRLLRPSNDSMLNINAFSIGGGTGLNKEAWEIISQCWEFDYMGAAEFEYGALPKSLKRFVKKNLIGFELIIPADKIKKIWEVQRENIKINDATVYVICGLEEKNSVAEAIVKIAGDKFELKEFSMFPDTLQKKYVDEKMRGFIKYCGWIDIINDFMFFTDKEMYERSLILFEGL